MSDLYTTREVASMLGVNVNRVHYLRRVWLEESDLPCRLGKLYMWTEEGVSALRAAHEGAQERPRLSSGVSVEEGESGSLLEDGGGVGEVSDEAWELD